MKYKLTYNETAKFLEDYKCGDVKKEHDGSNLVINYDFTWNVGVSLKYFKVLGVRETQKSIQDAITYLATHQKQWKSTILEID